MGSDDFLFLFHDVVLLQSIVASNGKLTENFEYIAELRESSMYVPPKNYALFIN